MRQLLTERTALKRLTSRRRDAATLNFRKITTADISRISGLLMRYASGRTCDYSIGGILMWVDYFGYSYAITDDTLFIKGVSEADKSSVAFAVPVGRMSLRQSVDLLHRYCASNHIQLRFSAVTEPQAKELEALGFKSVQLEDWSDYLYSIDDLAEFAGKKYNKKRNHVNRFIADNPGWKVEPLTADLLPAVRDFYVRFHLDPDKPDTATFEQSQVMKVLDNYGSYPFEGVVLSTPADGIVAFAVGECIGDTVFEHIEKMNHDVAGAGETICKEFAAAMRSRHPELRYVNREEDTGDEGLRRAKQSLHPVELLKKYDCVPIG